ncbi:unnamed protein product [Ectocarpus sp. 12 AP-2014]
MDSTPQPNTTQNGVRCFDRQHDKISKISKETWIAPPLPATQVEWRCLTSKHWLGRQWREGPLGSTLAHGTQQATSASTYNGCENSSPPEWALKNKKIQHIFYPKIYDEYGTSPAIFHQMAGLGRIADRNKRMLPVLGSVKTACCNVNTINFQLPCTANNSDG